MMIGISTFSDYNVKQYLGDQTLPPSIHEGTFTVPEAVQVLKMLRFIVGEVAVWRLAMPDYRSNISI